MKYTHSIKQPNRLFTFYRPRMHRIFTIFFNDFCTWPVAAETTQNKKKNENWKQYLIATKFSQYMFKKIASFHANQCKQFDPNAGAPTREMTDYTFECHIGWHPSERASKMGKNILSHKTAHGKLSTCMSYHTIRDAYTVYKTQRFFIPRIFTRHDKTLFHCNCYNTLSHKLY